ncbi:hypothetical protein GAYE_SCF01G1961 [Galdieria yellowstonensis]|uniref:Transducin family protein / WD-40 repeat family protein n=1 Tax=Galdieria yellowstonensis TaxID=3028027 RepID=A0AAV9I9K3_9RHOD|nr:hypothetical protein GAYE_SCF01G1961 [Galdieria yellowstonensis]
MPPTRSKRLVHVDNLQKENRNIANAATPLSGERFGKGKLVNIGRLPDAVDLLAFQDICPFTGTRVTYTPEYEFLRELQGRTLLCTIQQDNSGRPTFQVKETDSSATPAIMEKGYNIHELWNRICRKLNPNQSVPVNGLEAHGLLNDETRLRLSSLLEGEQTQTSLSVQVKDEVMNNNDFAASQDSCSNDSKTGSKEQPTVDVVETNPSESQPTSFISDDTYIPESLPSLSNGSANSKNVGTKEAIKRNPSRTSQKRQNSKTLEPSNSQHRQTEKNKGKRKKQQKSTHEDAANPESSNSTDHEVHKPLEEDLNADKQAQQECCTFGIEWIDESHPLQLYEKPLHHFGNLYCLSFNHDGSLLVSGSSTGTLCIWDTRNWERIGEFCDWETFDKELIEYLTCCFSPDSRYVIAAGVTRDRFSWNDEENENSVIPGTIRIFDVTSGKVTARLEGHLEEVFCVRIVKRDSHFYLVSCGEDGRICKFAFRFQGETPNQFDFSTACQVSTISVEAMVNDSEMDLSDCESFIAIDLQFLPRTNNRLFLVAVDSGLQLFDFDRETCIAKFPNLYTAYTDSICILPFSHGALESACSQDEENIYSWYLLTRGVEWLDNQGNLPRGNRCSLRRLSCISLSESLWSLESIRDYSCEEYYSNIWPCRLASQGRYVASGSIHGDIFVWHLSSGKLTAKLKGFDARKAIRTILFHPTKALLVTGGDDEYIHVWHQA